MITVRAAAEKVAEILIYDVIGADFFGQGVTAAKVKAELDALGEVSDINVRINSPGGNVWDGIAIFNLLKQHKAQVHVQIDGLAASAASLIAMSGDLITMGEGTLMMIHNPWTLAYGDAKAMRKTGDILDKIEAQFEEVYSARSGMKSDDVSAAMDAETWFTAEEAVKNGFADEKTTSETTEEAAAEARSEAWQQCLAVFKKTPKALLESLAAGKLPIAATSVQGQSGSPTKETTMTTEVSVTQADVTKAAGEAAQAALKAESARRAAIKTAFGRFADQHRELMDACLDDVNCTAAAAGEKLLAKLGDGVEPVGTGSIKAGADARPRFVAGATQALEVRMGLAKREQGNEFYGMGLVELAAKALALAGISVSGLTRDGIARKVLASMSTSDFPQLLSNTAGKVLRAAYGAFPATWQSWAMKGSVSDFKIHPRIQMGSFNNLALIPEGGEYTAGSLSEDYENAQAQTKGKILRLTRQMVVNDDLGGFQRRATLMGTAAARTVNADAYALLTSGASNHGPTTTDGGQFFNATAQALGTSGHANLTSSGTAISTASIALGRKQMRVLRDKGFKEALNILPKVLACPVGKEDIAWAVLNSITDVSQSNPAKKNYAYDVAKLDLVTDPYLDGISATAWYLFASPSDAAAAFEVAFLDGNDTPFIDEMVDFLTDAMDFKIRLDYGVANGDWRGGYKNVGA